MMVRVSLASCVMLLAGCGGGAGGGSSPIVDAAADSGPDVADLDSGACFPYCASGESSSPEPEAAADAAETCPKLQAAYEALELTAKACDPQLPSQCASTASDPCCPVTVGMSQSAIDDFNQVVAGYEQQCTADCSKRLCQPAPSDQCVGTGTAAGTRM